MKELLLIKDSLSNKISYYLVMLLLAALPFDQFYSHAIFGCLAVHTLIHLKKERLNQLLSPGTLLLQTVFFIALIGLTYTYYSADALTDITRKLVVLLFPLFFALTSLNLNKYSDHFLKFFTLVCIATVTYLYIHAFTIIGYFHMPVRAIISANFINHNFSAPIQMHATFFSLQVAIALFYLVLQFFKKQVAVAKLLYFFAAILLFAGLVQLGSKSVLIAVLIGLNIIVPYFLLSANKRLKYILVSGAVSILLFIGALSTADFRTRYVTDLKNDLSVAKVNETTDARLPRWTSAMPLIAKSPLVGYGTGSELNVLGDQFYKQRLYNAYLNKLNAHNQYLSFLISSGVIGLVVYLVTLFWGFRIAFRQKDATFFFFMLLIAIVSFSESLLNAEKGVFFYSLFFSFFVFSGQYQSIPFWFSQHKYLGGGATKRKIATSSL